MQMRRLRRRKAAIQTEEECNLREWDVDRDVKHEAVNPAEQEYPTATQEQASLKQALNDADAKVAV
jgi:hypothetical protein